MAVPRRGRARELGINPVAQAVLAAVTCGHAVALQRITVAGDHIGDAEQRF
jgi:hypothetical protein